MKNRFFTRKFVLMPKFAGIGRMESFMTKQEYMEQLKEKLSIFDEALAKEIADDYEGHFREGSDLGKTEEEICRELGSIDDIIEELGQLYEPKKKDDSKFQSTVNEVVNDALNIANNVAHTIVKEIKNGIDFGKRTWYEKTREDVVDAEYVGETICNCNKTVIDAGCADVKVELSENNEFHVSYVNHGGLKDKILYHFHGEQKGDIFYGRLIKEQGNSSLFHILKMPEIEIIVRIPKDFETVEVNAVSGGIELSGIHVKEISLSSMSGDIRAKNYEAVKTTIESASGDIAVKEVTGTTLKLKMKSGDALIEACTFEEVSAKSKSGDVLMKESKVTGIVTDIASGSVNLHEMKGESIQISEKSGDVTMKNCSMKELNLSADSSSVCAEGLEAEKLDVSSESGDINIHAKAAYYTLKTASGDISLESQSEMNGSIQSTSGDANIGIMDGGGYTAEINAVSGAVTLQYEGGSKYGMHKGVYIMGEGKSVLAVTNVSGDITIHG